MEILLTGGAGFIGSHLAERLLDLGHGVTSLDDLNDFYDPDVKRANIVPAQARPRYRFVRGSILSSDLLDDLFAETHFDALVHLAAWAGVRPSILRPAIYMEVNISGTLELLERCRTGGVRRVVFASSSSVYGGRVEVPFRETDSISRPVSPYAMSKAAGELLCHTYHHLHGLDVLCLRYFTVYGPRQRPEMAIHSFCRAVLEGRPVELFGDGSSSRDYTYIDDIVEGTVAALDRCKGFEIVNLGGAEPIRLDDLVALIGRVAGAQPRTEPAPEQPGDVPRTFADVSKAKALLGYEPKVRIEEGIERTIAWLRSRGSFTGQ
ncbi:MAG: GDP-mannose 4,6-dehydratase [Deltaproteobacteria bacterium]|nr:GDP-mannose 4,6-dehydratase [Deltaproteobacteria bacterium]